MRRTRLSKHRSRRNDDTVAAADHVYGASIKPVFRLALDYKRGPDVLEDDGSLEIGEKNGAWYLVALARLK